MKSLPHTPELLRAARRIIWFEPPETALSEPYRFAAYAMTYATPEDMGLILREIGLEGLREAIDHAPPGIIDRRSWAYWNAVVGRYPAPPMPVRFTSYPWPPSRD